MEECAVITNAMTVCYTMLSLMFVVGLWGIKKTVEMQEERLVVTFITVEVAIVVMAVLFYTLNRVWYYRDVGREQHAVPPLCVSRGFHKTS